MTTAALQEVVSDGRLAPPTCVALRAGLARVCLTQLCTSEAII